MCVCRTGKTTFVAALAGAMLVMTGTTIAQQGTEPAGATKELKGVTVRLWTCPTHEQFRSPEKGECPLCKTKLEVRKRDIYASEPLGDPYPLETCPVSGEKLGSMGRPLVLAYEDREVRLCCKGCVRSFEKDPDAYWAKVDGQIVEQQRATYPLDTCLVSGESLTEMGDPVEFVYKNRLVRLCCKMCQKKFMRSPAEHIKKLDAAVVRRQEDHYPLDTCLVAGGKLDSMGGPMKVVFGNRLVQFCCGGCLPRFWKDPAKYYAQLDAAWAKHGHAPGSAHEDGGRRGRTEGEHGGHDHDGGHGH